MLQPAVCEPARATAAPITNVPLRVLALAGVAAEVLVECPSTSALSAFTRPAGRRLRGVLRGELRDLSFCVCAVCFCEPGTSA